MSSKIARFCTVVLGTVIGAFLLLAGAFSLVAPWSKTIREEIIYTLLEDRVFASLLGVGMLLIGSAVLIYSYSDIIRKEIVIQVGKFPISIDPELLQQYLQIYWQEHFPQQAVPFSLKIKRKAIHVKAHLPFMPETEQKLFLERVQNDFCDLFSRVLGCPQEVRLIATFPKQ